MMMLMTAAERMLRLMEIRTFIRMSEKIIIMTAGISTGHAISKLALMSEKIPACS